jgi:hypothetical protein
MFAGTLAVVDHQVALAMPLRVISLRAIERTFVEACEQFIQH